MADDVVINPGMGAGMEGKMPSREELLEAIQKMDMDEESRTKLIQSIMSGMSPEYAPIEEEPAVVATASGVTFEILMLLCLISLVLAVLGENM